MLKFACSKFIIYTFQRAINIYIGANQTVWMHRLVCAFVVRVQLSPVFSRHGSNRPLKQSFNDYEAGVILIIVSITARLHTLTRSHAQRAIDNCINKFQCNDGIQLNHMQHERKMS